MPYPYGTQGAPAVGNGLGGLPRRAAAAAAAAASTPVEATYTFAQTGAATSSTASTNAGGMLYFDDSNIFWLANSSSGGCKAVFNRSTGAVTSVVAQDPIMASGNAPSDMSAQLFDIRISNTVVASSSTGRKATRSGNSITLDYVAPLSGTLTVGGYAYSVNSWTVRSNQSGSLHVAFAKDINSTTYMNVVVLDSTLSIVKSFRYAANSIIGAGWVNVNGVINASGTFIAWNKNSSTPVQINIHAVNLGTETTIAAASHAFSASGGTMTSWNVWSSYFDFATNAVTIQSYGTDGSAYYPIGYQVTYSETNNVFTHFNGQTGGSASNSLAFSTAVAPYFSSNNALQFLIGISGTYKGYSKFGFPYAWHAPNLDNSYTLKVPMAQPSSLDLSDFVITPPVVDVEAGSATGLVSPRLTMQCRGKYQAYMPGTSYGFMDVVATNAIDIGDNFFLSMQQRNLADGYVSCCVVKRTVTQP